MTQAPTPGPLDDSSTRLLRSGDWIRFKNDPPVQVSSNDVTCGSPHWSFIGRPDADGWMPWSGGENPVPGQMVEVRWTNGLVEQYYSDIVSWRKGGVMVEAFRLAPTAPVEASGSERERIKDALMRSKGWPHDLHPGPAADAILALLSARPLAFGGQHSTPTDFPPDDVLACDTTPARAEAQDEGAIKAAYKRGWNDRESDIIERAERIAPMTTPDRDEGAAGEPVEDLTDQIGVEWSYHEDDIYPPRDFWHVRANIGDLSTDWIKVGAQQQANLSLEERGAGERKAIDTVKQSISDLYAHPSPPPAADEDRVREAIADVISHENDWRTALTAMDAAEETPEDGSGKPGYWIHQIKVLDRIVAALKSTAAKEGGE